MKKGNLFENQVLTMGTELVNSICALLNQMGHDATLKNYEHTCNKEHCYIASSQCT